MSKNKLLIIFALFLLTGCTNAFKQFYKPYTQIPFERTKEVQAFSFNNADEVFSLMKKGFIIVGTSDFSAGGNITKEQAISHGKNVGADIVLISSKYLNTQQGVLPILQYQPGQSATVNTYSNYHTTASAYGSGGYAYGYGDTSGSSTSYISTPGTYSTQYLPYSYNRYEYHAIYLKKIDTKELKLGVQFGEISPEMRKKLGTNSGVLLWLVYEGTPAYYSDVMDGDIVLECDGQRVNDPMQFSEMLKNISSKTINLKIWRNGTTINKKIEFN
ncbi:MAG: hypothetical protein ACTSYY_11595 [Promethearchaeota archaeon]